MPNHFNIRCRVDPADARLILAGIHCMESKKIASGKYFLDAGATCQGKVLVEMQYASVNSIKGDSHQCP
jgi:hypothetical protein